MKVGVLALQGAFPSHHAALTATGVNPTEVRTPQGLADVDALVIPGGESTTMLMLLDSSQLRTPLVERIQNGLPVFGTCAGMILLSTNMADGRPDQQPLGLIDLDVRRNGYGRQIASFEADLDVSGLDHPFRGVFIRAPLAERIGPKVEVLASVDGHGVLCQQENILVSSFHPELTNDLRLHQLFVDRAFAAQ